MFDTQNNPLAIGDLLVSDDMALAGMECQVTAIDDERITLELFTGREFELSQFSLLKMQWKKIPAQAPSYFADRKAQEKAREEGKAIKSMFIGGTDDVGQMPVWKCDRAYTLWTKADGFCGEIPPKRSLMSKLNELKGRVFATRMKSDKTMQFLLN